MAGNPATATGLRTGLRPAGICSASIRTHPAIRTHPGGHAKVGGMSRGADILLQQVLRRKAPSKPGRVGVRLRIWLSRLRTACGTLQAPRRRWSLREQDAEFGYGNACRASKFAPCFSGGHCRSDGRLGCTACESDSIARDTGQPRRRAAVTHPHLTGAGGPSSAGDGALAACKCDCPTLALPSQLEPEDAPPAACPRPRQPERASHGATDPGAGQGPRCWMPAPPALPRLQATLPAPA